MQCAQLTTLEAGDTLDHHRLDRTVVRMGWLLWYCDSSGCHSLAGRGGQTLKRPAPSRIHVLLITESHGCAARIRAILVWNQYLSVTSDPVPEAA